jgi:hypothetical protein
MAFGPCAITDRHPCYWGGDLTYDRGSQNRAAL